MGAGWVRAGLLSKFPVIRRALVDAEVLGRIRQLGGDVFADASQQSAGQFIAAQQALWAKLIKERNITTG